MPNAPSIKVTVTFPLAHEPFHAEETSEKSIGAVRKDAMKFFGVSEDPGSVYYLSHDGVREPDDRTVGDIAGHAHAVKFTLVKELIQG